MPKKDETITNVDFDDLMERLHVGFAMHESHGEMVSIPDWTTEQGLAALEIIRREVIPLGKPVLLKKHPARWIYCTILRELSPLGVWIAQHDGSTVPLQPPQIGQNGVLEVSLQPRKNRFLLQYAMPGTGPAERDYSINFTNLGQLVLPPVPPGQHILIRTLGSSAVPAGMALVYGNEAASLWIAEPDASVFKCAVSNCADCAVGDELTAAEAGECKQEGA